MVGKTLGHYEILGPLGAGGMGEVYRARDPRLERDVAIKVLPEPLGADPEHMARFEREAKLLAQLNHPNIAGIYGLEDAAGVRFIAMECVEGETLAERVASRGRIELDDALEIARQIAEALEAAHGAGIVHRDLKPANVIVAADGQAKVLDFGLAKVWEADATSRSAGTGSGSGGPDGDLSHSPTIMDATRSGVILGTAAYMSPEQARGKPVDKRTDIWAFGCVLFEMLAGKRAFGGETVSDMLATILKQEPDWSCVPGTVPPSIRRLLHRCLTKSTRDRLQHIGDARIEIEATIAGVEPEGTAEQVVDSPRRPVGIPALPWLITFASIVGLVWAVAGRTPAQDPGSVPRMRSLSLSLPESTPLASSEAHPLGAGRILFAIAPDGGFLVYVGERDSQVALYRRSLTEGSSETGPMGEPSVQPIPGTDGAVDPFFSPDGDWIGFFTATHLMKVSVRGGGMPTPIAEVRNGLGAAWGADGWIYFSQQYFNIARVPEEGGEIEIVASDTSGLLSPHLLPDGTLLAATNPYLRAGLVHIDLDGVIHPLLDGFTSARWAPGGNLIVARSSSLFVVPVDLPAMTVAGSPSPIAHGARHEFLGEVQFAVGPAGELVFAPGRSATVSRPVWVDPDGREEALGFDYGPYDGFALSPDGRRLALVHGGASLHIRVHDLEDGSEVRLTQEGNNRSPVWSSDGQWVLFTSDRGGQGNYDLYRKRSDGSGAAERLTSTPEHNLPFDWPAGCACVILGDNQRGLRLSLDGAGVPEPLDINPSFVEWGHQLSPSGKWLAFTSDESAQYEVWVADFDDLGARRQITFGSGEEPRWSRDGRRLYFKPSGHEWAYFDFAPETGETLGRPRVVAEGDFRPIWGMSYDVGPDGRLLLLRPQEQESRTRLVVVLDAAARLVESTAPFR